MNSMAQQAVPNGNGHRLFLRAASSTASSLVVTNTWLPSGWRAAAPAPAPPWMTGSP